jgi:hypothetical protein
MLIKHFAIIPLMCATLYAQPQGDPPPPREESSTHRPLDPDQGAEALKQRLEQTLLFAQRIVEKHEEAIAQLEAGEDPKEVMRSLRAHDLKGNGRLTRRDRANSHESRTQERSPKEFRSPPPSYDEQTLNNVRVFIANHLPAVDQQLTTIEQVSPRATNQLLDRLAPKILEIMSFEGDNSAMFSLKLDELRAGLQYVEASRHYRGLLRTGESDKEKIKEAEETVRQAASARFDAQVHIKQYEIHQLTMRIEQLHDALEELNEQRDDQVQAQVNAARRTPGPRMDQQPNRSSSGSDDD